VADGVTRRLVVPIAALVLAAVLAALATGAFAVDRELATGARADGPAAAIAGRLVGSNRQRALKDAIALAAAQGGTLAAQVRRRQEAAQLLAGPAAGGSSRAANLLGVLSVQAAGVDPSHARQSLTEAQAWFVAAIRADQRDEDAKVNLELLLAQRTKQKHNRARQSGGEPRRGRGSLHRTGSGY
jgi:hypothetical protein